MMKLKIFSKQTLILITCLSLSVFLLSPLNAKASNLASTVAEYNLEQGGTQYFIISDSNGDSIYVTITEEFSMSKLSNGTYKITYSKPLSWEAGFNVVISSNKITSVNSPFYKVTMGGILSPSLVKDSSTQASYHFIYKLAGIYTNTGVRTILSGTTLKTSAI